jgi:hypothetical protein
MKELMPDGERGGALRATTKVDARRLLMLICEGWVPQDRCSSQAFHRSRG